MAVRTRNLNRIRKRANAKNGSETAKPTVRRRNSHTILYVLPLFTLVWFLNRERVIQWRQGNSKDSSSSYHLAVATTTTNIGSLLTLPDPTPEPPLLKPKVPIYVFYNLYLKERQEKHRVLNFVREQFQPLKNNSDTYASIYVKSIGGVIKKGDDLDLFPDTDDNTGSIRDPLVQLSPYTEGDESLSLRHLWKFCRRPGTDPDQIVVYMHSKGSYTVNQDNDKLRNYLTKAALSRECNHGLLRQDKQCSVCSARLSPLPHPHVSGNMWAARCDYIAKLENPSNFPDVMDKYARTAQVSRSELFWACRGMKRYSFEHWVHSHPHAVPCDVDGTNGFAFGYSGIPKDYHLDLKLAPRFPLDFYQLKEYDYCKGAGVTVEERLKEYKILYNTTPTDNWWGWKVLKQSGSMAWYPANKQ